MVLVPILASCGGEEFGPLDDLQVIGVDYELGSMLLTNIGASEVRTQGLWVYQEGEFFEFQIFSIAPRATILFSLRNVGGADRSGGEIALFAGDSFSDPDAMIDYVAWGRAGRDKSALASEAGLWGPDEFVETQSDTEVILRADQANIGAVSWIIPEDD
jgi:hypothetical protein